MSVAAVLLVKDEADIIRFTVEHLFTQVDEVIVADNMSSDGTREILEELGVVVIEDSEVGYYQDRKTTELAMRALGRGHEWVIPCDADEIWYSVHARVGDLLTALPEDTLFVEAELYSHITTNLDDPTEANPIRRLGWRFVDKGALPKVACRLSGDLRIGMGNHEAWTQGVVHSRRTHTTRALSIRHYPWRSVEQFRRKISNGAKAYSAAPSLDPAFGEHWKAFGLPGEDGFEERVDGWFWAWGHRADPGELGDLLHDPAPIYLAEGEDKEEKDG